MTRPTHFDGWIHPEDDEPGAMPSGWWIIPGFVFGVLFWMLIGFGLGQIGDAITAHNAERIAEETK